MGRLRSIRPLASVALLLCLHTEAGAQYFGRNKVQYDRDNVRVFSTEHFDIYHSDDNAAAAQMAGRLAERWYRRLSQVLDHRLRGRQPLVLYGSHRRFEQTNVHGGLIDESTGGFTDSRKRRIVLPFGASLAETNHVLGHEIVHAFQFDIADESRSSLMVPLWFVEGMAEYLTIGPEDPQTAMWMRDAVAADELPSIAQLSSGRYFPYRWGAALWGYLAEEYGADLPARSLRARRDVRRRLEQATGRSLDELTRAWHASLREKHGGPRAAVDPPSPLLSTRAGGGRLNLAASLSPDGRHLIFLSERDQFSIDLYLADARDGRVIRKLLTTAATADFESLQYLYSAGSWDPSGSRFALATVRRGRPMLIVLDVERGSDAQEIALSGVDEAYSPTWAPDGGTIAFAAMKAGMTDLFLVNLSSGATRQLTRDAYADLQPAWSPDGRTLAFATDRFTTSLPRLESGSYRIALLDLATLAIEATPGIAGANQVDPAWAPGGDRLYFVSDPDGIGNVFRLELSTGELHRITDVETAVTGVTRVSPTLTVASRTGALAYTLFRQGGYEIHAIDPERARSGDPIPTETVAIPGPVAGVSSNPIEPVPPLPALAAARSSHRPYRPKLTLEGIGSPYFSAGGGPIGGYVAGGASLLFGDLLGDQQLLTAAHISSQLDESAFAAVYINRASRWTWGVTLEQTPDLRLRTTGIRVDPDDQRVLTRERERLIWTNRELGGFLAYPFDRSRRLELSAAIRQIGFGRERRTDVVSLTSGRIVEQEARPLAPEPSVGMADAGIALIGDTAMFGATGPMLGTRYRLQATTTLGALKYTSVLADYRRYVMPVRPYTLAFRIVHSGRYGTDASDFRLRDAYVGSASLVRGYGVGSVVRAECPRGTADCPTLNTLLANRIVAAKVEVRVPVWSTLTSSTRVRYGPLPVDAFAFADAGAGWGGEQRFGSAGVDGRFVRSVGAGVRANVYGLVFEAAGVRPLDLRAAGWSFAFSMRSGF